MEMEITVSYVAATTKNRTKPSVGATECSVNRTQSFLFCVVTSKFARAARRKAGTSNELYSSFSQQVTTDVINCC